MFTTLSVLTRALLERDVCEDDGEIAQKSLPFIYYIGRESTIFNIKNFVYYSSLSLIESILIFFFTSEIMVNTTQMSITGQTPDLWASSITQFTCVILMVNYRLIITQRFHTLVNILMISISSYLSYIGYIIFGSYFDYSTSQATLHELIYFPHFYLVIFLISSLSLIYNLAIETWEIEFSNKPSSRIRKYIKVNYFLY